MTTNFVDLDVTDLKNTYSSHQSPQAHQAILEFLHHSQECKDPSNCQKCSALKLSIPQVKHSKNLTSMNVDELMEFDISFQ